MDVFDFMMSNGQDEFSGSWGRNDDEIDRKVVKYTEYRRRVLTADDISGHKE